MDEIFLVQLHPANRILTTPASPLPPQYSSSPSTRSELQLCRPSPTRISSLLLVQRTSNLRTTYVLVAAIFYVPNQEELCNKIRTAVVLDERPLHCPDTTNNRNKRLHTFFCVERLSLRCLFLYIDWTYHSIGFTNSSFEYEPNNLT